MSPFRPAEARGRLRARRLATTALLLTILPIVHFSGIGAAAADEPDSRAGSSASTDASGAEQRKVRRVDNFVVATFNVLGHSHTTGARSRPRFDASAPRLVRALEVLDRTGIDVVGFQELQRPQYKQFRANTVGEWAIYRGSRTDSENSIAWRKDKFRLVRGWNVAIPYFHGNRRQMPVVMLKSRETGQRIFVMNVHNPADTRGNASKWRRIAVAKERAVTTRLTRRQNAPVLLTGDMNDRARFFCQVTKNGVLHSVFGGSHRMGRCNPPASGIDWILGNKFVDFVSHKVDRSRLVNATTDHPVVSSHVRVASR